MKMTLPFKPHVLALICSAGLCAASTGLYIKSRTVEAPVEPQSTQLAVSDAAAVTFPATVSAPPVTPAVVKSAFSTAQIDQWVAPVALYPDALLSQVLMASTYPTNVAQAVQWSHDNPLKQGDAAIQAVSDQPWDASVKSLVAFPQLMALMGENPQWVQNLGDAFLAQPQDVMDSVQRLRQLAQQTGSLKSSTEQKVITTTKKAVPVKQTVTAPVIPSNTVLTANPVITEPATTVISIEPANPDVVYIPNYNPTVVYGNWANTAYPPVYLPPPAGEPFVDSFVRGFGYSMGVATRTHYSAASTGTTTIMTIIIMTMMIIITTMAVIVTVMAGNTTATTSISTSTISTVSPVSILLIRIWHGGTIQTTVMVCPIMIRIWQSGFHQTDVNGGMSATQLPAPTRDSQRQAAANQFQQRTHAAPVITRDTQRQAAAQRFNEAEHYGSYDDFHDFSRRQPLTQQQKDAARQRYQSASPEQRQAVRERMQTNPKIQQRREAARERIQSASPEQRQAVREKMQTNPQNQQRRDAARERIQSASPEQRQVFKEKVQQRPLNQQQRDNARQRVQSASPEQRQVFREKVQESRPQRLNDSNHTVRLNNEQRSAVCERLSERGARRLER
ncbi:Cdk activating kinase (CAK)/RNA polymerase II transcription initiation/nucleotide excision repair factor TFIIH/TFIIK, cyclin H subunit [Escherichia coli]|nr:Cdk activating kinase (CAK)/RNA polymerase II transcription initiation/nucleotide excision repair factor TFIIH/TFIIK, cyclin H subunit [Escherichia coli]